MEGNLERIVKEWCENEYGIFEEQNGIFFLFCVWQRDKMVEDAVNKQETYKITLWVLVSSIPGGLDLYLATV